MFCWTCFHWSATCNCHCNLYSFWDADDLNSYRHIRSAETVYMHHLTEQHQIQYKVHEYDALQYSIV